MTPAQQTQPQAHVPISQHALGFRRWLSPILYLCSAIIIVNVFFLSWGDLKTYPGVDLRAKVVGARRLAQGLDPYYDPYLEAPPDHLRMRMLNTYSPALLTLYIPLRTCLGISSGLPISPSTGLRFCSASRFWPGSHLQQPQKQCSSFCLSS